MSHVKPSQTEGFPSRADPRARPDQCGSRGMTFIRVRRRCHRSQKIVPDGRHPPDGLALLTRICGGLAPPSKHTGKWRLENGNSTSPLTVSQAFSRTGRLNGWELEAGSWELEADA